MFTDQDRQMLIEVHRALTTTNRPRSRAAPQRTDTETKPVLTLSECFRVITALDSDDVDLTPWEEQFVKDMVSRDPARLSPKQKEVIERMHMTYRSFLEDENAWFGPASPDAEDPEVGDIPF